MNAVSAVNSTSEAKATLARYQDKLASDLATKAAAQKVIDQDKEMVAKAQQAVQQTQQTSAATTSAAAATSGSSFNVLV